MLRIMPAAQPGFTTARENLAGNYSTISNKGCGIERLAIHLAVRHNQGIFVRLSP